MTHDIAEVINLDAYPEMAELIYVCDSEPGIERIRTTDGFDYYFANHKLTSEKQLKRIKSLVIPPAWEKVWICKSANGHIQCTGYDARGRKQYRYHSLWQKSRNESKFSRLMQFGKALKKLRQQINSDINRRKLCEEKVIATVLALMDETHIRVGNSQYEKSNKSYGLTTMKDRHVQISGSSIRFAFVGKKGIRHNITLKNKRLARIVKQCRDIPGKELFQYYDEQGHRHSIDSGKVNAYIKKYTNGEFTAKDIRTWSGTVHAIHGFIEVGTAENPGLCKKNIVHVLDMVSEHLGNTRTVCKKYYVHPKIIELYESGQLESGFHKAPASSLLKSEELLLLRILRQAG